MRRLIAVFVAVAAVVAVPTARAADATVHVVHPTGTYPIDVQNVQAAVADGGTVVLKATDVAGAPTAFDFGPATDLGGTVDLTVDVEVVGETIGSATTTIRGGWVPLFGREAVTTRIEGITFDGPMLSAVLIAYSSGAEIVGNRIVGVVGSLLPGVSGVTDLTEGRGIKLLGNNDPAGAITGTVTIAGNTIDDMHADLSDAIVFDAVAADVVVRDNVIGTTQSAGILAIETSGSMTIVDNVIRPGPGDPGEQSHGGGVVVAGGTGALRIEHNEIVCENAAADGIHVIGGGQFAPVTDAAIHDNDVTMASSAHAAIALEDAVSGAAVTGNVVHGAANHGVELRGNLPDSVADGNRIADNDLTAFDARAGAVFLDRHTRRTTLSNAGGLATDMGSDNVLDGLTRYPDAPPQAALTASALVPLPGSGQMVEPITAASVPLDIAGDGHDNARITVVATPTTPGDVDLILQRELGDGTWFTVGKATNFDIEREQLVVRRQPPGRYRVLVHSFAGGPQLVDVVVTFAAQR